MSEYVTKDSGERAQFDSGMQRDTEAGKPRFDLTWPEGIPFDEQLLVRFAKLMGRGAEKYTERNWESANSEAEIKRMKSSAWRHFMQWYAGDRDEDHAAAVIFNLMATEATEYKLHHDHTEELDRIADQILSSQGTTPIRTHPTNYPEPPPSADLIGDRGPRIETDPPASLVPNPAPVNVVFHSIADQTPSQVAEMVHEAFAQDRRRMRAGGIATENLRF